MKINKLYNHSFSLQLSFLFIHLIMSCDLFAQTKNPSFDSEEMEELHLCPEKEARLGWPNHEFIENPVSLRIPFENLTEIFSYLGPMEKNHLLRNFFKEKPDEEKERERLHSIDGGNHYVGTWKFFLNALNLSLFRDRIFHKTLLVGRPLEHSADRSKSLLSVEISPYGRFALTHSTDKSVKVYDFFKGKTIFSKGLGEWFQKAVFVGNEITNGEQKPKFIYFSRSFGTGKVMSMENEAYDVSLYSPINSLIVGSFSPKNNYFLNMALNTHKNYSEINAVRFDNKTGIALSEPVLKLNYTLPSDQMLPLEFQQNYFSPDENWVVLSHYGANRERTSELRIWNIENHKSTDWENMNYSIRYKTISYKTEKIKSFHFSPDSKFIFLILENRISKNVDVVDLEEGKIKFSLDHLGLIEDLSFSFDGSMVVSTCNGNTCFVFFTSDGRELHQLQGSYKKITVAKFSPEMNRIVASDEGGGIYLWDVTLREKNLLWQQDMKQSMGIGNIIFTHFAGKGITFCDGDSKKLYYLACKNLGEKTAEAKQKNENENEK